MALLEQVTKLRDYNVQLKTENAELQSQLAKALADDAADKQAIADAEALAETAKTEAQAAKDSVAPLQALADKDASEDAQVQAILDSVVYPE